jgi:hypothetical protein
MLRLRLWRRSRSEATGGDGNEMAFGALLDAEHHLALHHELNRTLEAGHQGAAAAADEQSGRVLAEGLEDERPAAARLSGGQLSIAVLDVAQDQGAARLDQRHRVGGRIPSHPDHPVPDLEGLLELRQDPVGAVHVTADEVLQPVVAVETAASLPELHQPRPDLGGRRMDGDRVRPDEAGPGDELVTGPGGLVFLVGGAPLGDPRPCHHDIEHTRDQQQRPEYRDDELVMVASLSIPTSITRQRTAP